MDFGVLGLEGLMGPENGAPSYSHQVSVVNPPEAMTKQAGSIFVKPERSGFDDDDKGAFKMAKTVDFSASKTMPLHQTTTLLRSNSVVSGDSTRQQEQMLSFSSYKSQVPFLTITNGLVERNSQATTFPFYQHIPSASAYTRSAGYGSGSLNASMHGLCSGARGPFTPAQWMELEHQALIYKYIIANVPIPSNLLMPIRKSLYPFGLPFSGSYAPNSYGWGTFHLGYSGNTDPEPGRCRRTDGKKWRCSRDAVADQKYCERHINRGRHRSRKPVEGQTGQAASGTTNSKVVPMSSVSTSVITSGGASNSLAVTQHEFRNLQPVAANPSAEALVSRVQDSQSVSMISSTINLKPSESTFSIPKQDFLLEESSQSVFGLVSSDSLLNPSQRSSYSNSKSYGGSFPGFTDQENQEQLPLRQFIDDWPKDESNHSVITWPEELKSDWTQLSMSIPIVSSEFSSSSCSPANEKLALSPLKLSRELDSIQVALGVNNDLDDSKQKQTNWIPISWGTSMGGPLGEVLTNASNNVGTCKNSSPNLLTEGWDGSPHLGSSPTGVLHKSTFCSLSSSSSGSSPITENKKTHDGASLCDDVVGSTRISSSSIPSQDEKKAMEMKRKSLKQVDHWELHSDSII